MGKRVKVHNFENIATEKYKPIINRNFEQSPFEFVDVEDGIVVHYNGESISVNRIKIKDKKLQEIFDTPPTQKELDQWYKEYLKEVHGYD